MGVDAARHIVIMTALAVEHEAVLRHLTTTVEERHPRGTIYGRTGFLSWDVLVAQVGTGNTSAAQETERAIEYFNPRLALFVGIAGGIKDLDLGDVVAATKVYGYEYGVDRESFKPRPDVGLSAYPLVQEARAVAREAQWQRRICSAPSFQRSPIALVAPIAAGEKVVKASRGSVASLLRSAYGDAVAVEMEGAGFLRAAYASSVDALIIRAISDLLDDKAEVDAGGSQRVASDHAAAFAFELLTRLAERSAAQVAETSRVTDERGVSAYASDAAEIWDRLHILAPRLYPRGPDEKAVWEDAGGDLSRLDLADNGRTQWSHAIRLLQKGGLPKQL